MWRGIFVAIFCGLFLGLLQLAKQRGWRFGFGTLLAVMTLLAILLGVVFIDLRWAAQ